MVYPNQYWFNWFNLMHQEGCIIRKIDLIEISYIKKYVNIFQMETDSAPICILYFLILLCCQQNSMVISFIMFFIQCYLAKYPFSCLFLTLISFQFKGSQRLWEAPNKISFLDRRWVSDLNLGHILKAIQKSKTLNKSLHSVARTICLLVCYEYD